MSSRKIKVLVVDDSILFREILIRNLGKDAHLEIVGYAVDSFDAFDKIKALNPDVVTLDVEMPRMNGIEFLKKLMPEHPLPVVVVSSLPINALDALDAGAVDLVKKPLVRSPEDTAEFIRELAAKIKIASIARIGRLKPRQDGQTPSGREPSAFADRSGSPKEPALLRTGFPKTRTPDTYDTLRRTASAGTAKIEIIAIGASTGGTDAIVEVVRDLPADSPGVVIVQHMPAGFTKMYAQRLDRVCRMSVKECEDGDRVEQGKIILAAGGYHMRLAKDARGYYVKSTQGPKVSGHCPSVDALFESVADAAGSKAIGVILTGMGADGAKGLLKMRQSGSYTIGQDKDSCVVYGMPMAAKNIGAVEKQLPLERINAEILQICRTGNKLS